MKKRLLVLTFSMLALASCDEGQSTPASQIFVLVDLSKTWDQPAKATENDETLREVGNGISIASADLDTPISVQYRVIGANSLERPPLCDVLYVPKLAPTLSAVSYEINSRSKLSNYLSNDCLMKIKHQSAEPLTEIRTAVASVANEPATGATTRDLIIISDFLEETAAPVTLDSNLKGFHAVLVYRPVAQDLNNPSVLRFRLDAWKAELEAHGAKVDIVPDAGIKRSTVAYFLTQGQKS